MRYDQVLSDAKLTKFYQMPGSLDGRRPKVSVGKSGKLVEWQILLAFSHFCILYFRCHKMQAFVSWQFQWGCQHLFVGLNAVECRCRQLLGLDHSCQCSTTRFPVETCKNRIHGQVHEITKPSINRSNLLSFSIWTGTRKTQQSFVQRLEVELRIRECEEIVHLTKTRFSFSQKI